MWQSRKLQILWNDSVSQWSNDSCSENECHSLKYVQNVESYSCTVPAWTSNASEASLIIQELWAKMIQAFFMHHPTKGKRQSDNNHSNSTEGEVLQYVWSHVKSVSPFNWPATIIKSALCVMQPMLPNLKSNEHIWLSYTSIHRGCPDDRHNKIKICIKTNVPYLHVQFAPSWRKTLKVFIHTPLTHNTCWCPCTGTGRLRSNSDVKKLLGPWIIYGLHQRGLQIEYT